MSIENRPSRYISRLLSALIFAASVQACEALPEESPTISKPTLTTELTPPCHLPKSEVILIISPTPEEKIIFPSPTPTVEITPTPTPHPTPTFTPIPESSPTPTKEVEISEIILSLWEEKTYQAIQELREGRGLPALELSQPLTEVARERSFDMATNNYFSHKNSESREVVFDLLDKTGVYYSYAGEILILYRTDVNDSQIDWAIREAMRQFLDSDDHQKVLLRENYSLIGIGYTLSEEDNFRYVTIVFASP